MREKAERLTRAAEQWERGAEGERLVGALLEVLPPQDWAVFHDLRWPGRQRANIDHVAVGPTGVFVIDAKNWGGTVDFRDGVPRQDGRIRQPTVNAASDAARAVARVTTSISPLHLHPVLCFVSEEVVSGRAGEVLLCSTANLAQILQQRPPVLTDATRARVCRDIHEYMRSAATMQPPALPSPRPTAARPTKAPRGRRGRARRGVAAAVSFAVGIGLLATVAASDVPERIGDLLTSVAEDGDRKGEPRKVDRQREQKDKKTNRREERPRTTR